MRMKRYKLYKQTGISWLPEIPAHWEEKRLATRFHGRVEANSDFEFKRAFKFNYGTVVPKNEVGDPTEYRDVYVKYSKVLQNDILINGLNLNYDFGRNFINAFTHHGQHLCRGIIVPDAGIQLESPLKKQRMLMLIQVCLKSVWFLNFMVVDILQSFTMRIVMWQ